MTNDESPFPFQGPLTPTQVTGREELGRDLAERLMEHRVTALLGPRRFGKTSLLKRVTADLAQVGPQTVWIDLYEIGTLADLASAIDRGLAASRGRIREILDSIAGTFSLKLGLVGLELSKGRNERPDPSLTARLLMDVLVRAAQRQKLIVVFDEFSGIANVPHGAGILRTALQHHYQQISLVFAGSQPSTMRMLFSDRAQPFFAQANLIEIGPLPDDVVVSIIHDGFARTGHDAGPATTHIVATARGHPQRAMQLSDAVWRLTPEGTEADNSTWERALADVRAEVDAGSERLFEPLPFGHQRTLRAIAADGKVYGRSAEVLELSSGAATAAVSALIGHGDIVRRDGRLAVVDPLYADWIRRRFPLPA